jgi:proteasome accessory factor A
MRSLMGLETEYAVMTPGQGTGEGARGRVVGWLLSTARRELCCLPDAFLPGLYLENGARLYLDTGNHPEFSTPECPSPRDAVRYALAGDRIIASLLPGAAPGRRGIDMTVYRSNVDHSGTGTTWGCHESYLYQSDPRGLARQVIPHLVSRIVYTGAGGFNNRTRGVEFTISPRVPHLVRALSPHSTTRRGIFHTKNESLCGEDFNRLHVLSGESLCSQLGNLLKMGTTALVVLLADAGRSPAPKVQFADPLEAMRSYAADPSCTSTARLETGEQVTAIEVQRTFLEAAEQLVASGSAPEWAEEICHEWRTILAQLEGAPESICTTLDWGIKLAIYQDRARRAGIPWVSRPPLRLRNHLLELDTRFADITPMGIFNMLDAAGVLSHQRLESCQIEDAIHNPPQSGRARKRGGYIRQLRDGSGRYGCDWEGIYDRETGQRLPLNDPFGEGVERWETTVQTEQNL